MLFVALLFVNIVMIVVGGGSSVFGEVGELGCHGVDVDTWSLAAGKRGRG